MLKTKLNFFIRQYIILKYLQMDLNEIKAIIANSTEETIKETIYTILDDMRTNSNSIEELKEILSPYNTIMVDINNELSESLGGKIN